MTQVSDLIPELQGRFPIRVELSSLRADDFLRILTETEYSLIKQYQAMLQAEGVTLQFDPESLKKMAETCEQVNADTEDIGARRLHTILEYVLEDLSFTASERPGEEVVITAEFVEERLSEVAESRDLNKYVL